MLRIPPQIADKLQPLDVNFNHQLKLFYNRIMEEAFYQDILPNITSREGIINIQSLLHNQFSSPKYKDMIKCAWRNTDPAFNVTELGNFPPKMVNSIQFDFDAASKCQTDSCDRHAFVECAHCGRLHCLRHFLERSCLHATSHGIVTLSRRRRELCSYAEDDSETCSTDASPATTMVPALTSVTTATTANQTSVVPVDKAMVKPSNVEGLLVAGVGLATTLALLKQQLQTTTTTERSDIIQLLTPEIDRLPTHEPPHQQTTGKPRPKPKPSATQPPTSKPVQSPKPPTKRPRMRIQRGRHRSQMSLFRLINKLTISLFFFDCEER